MERERYQRIKRLVMEADALPGARRAAFLEAACGDDAALRAEVERLLRPATVDTRSVTPQEVRSGELAATRELGAAPPPGTRIGPYEVGAELGRGGMGVVCAARDTRDDGAVALKLVYPHLLATPGVRERFAREARLGARVEHENVVRTLGTLEWEHDGVRHDVLVMERVRGRNLRERLAEWERLPEALVREVARQVASGLAAVHDAGVVHRDLKPENVILTDDQRVRIMDLGIAKVHETTLALTREGHFVGSLAYAAPEQLEGGEVGPECDLYALGVVLYELLCGDNPFRHDDLGACVAAHLGPRPPSVADRIPDVSRFLSDVVDTLLARSKTDRFATAQDLLATLIAGESGTWWSTRAHPPQVRGAPPEIATERPTSLHGRRTDLEALEHAWEAARAGTGRVVLLEGEPGIGKTRLLDAFARAACDDAAHVLYGAFPPSGEPRGLTAAIETALGDGAVAAEVAELFDTSSGDTLRDETLRRDPAAIDALALGEGALTALCCRVLRRLAAEGPVLWIVDDLHDARASGRAAVLAMARLSEALPVLLVLATRDPLPAAETQELQRVPEFAARTLARMSAKEVILLLEEALGSEALADRLGARIARKSDGVPFFVFEMLRALRDAGCLTRGEDGSFALTRSVTDVEVPSAIRDLVSTRLDEVTREERETLDVAAVIGGEFDAALVAAVLQRSLVRTLQDLAELERRRGIVRSVGGGHRFDHQQFRDVLYEELPPALRAEYHALVADAIAARTPDAPDERVAVDLARHHLRGSRPGAGVPHLQPALDHLQTCHRAADAADLAELALSHGGLLDDRERVRLHLRASGQHDVLGQRDPQLSHAQSALSIAERLGDARLLAAAHHALGGHAFSVHDSGEAVSRMRSALAHAREADDEGLVIDALTKLGGALSLMHDHDAAREVLDEARAAAAARGDGAREGEALRATASLVTNQYRYDEALELVERARVLLEEAGELRGAASAHSLWGSLSWYLGRVDDARTGFRRCLEIGRQIGERRLEVNARGRLGLASLHGGRLEDALRQFRHHRDGGVETGDAAAVGQAHANLSQTLGLLGCYEESLEDALRARHVGEVIDGRRMVSFAGTQASTALRHLGRLAEARASVVAAEAIARDLGDGPLEAQALLERATIDETEGDKASALGLLRRVEEMARGGKADRLTDAANIGLARLGGGDAAAAWERYAQYEAGLAVHQRLQARHNLWRATGDREHLTAAHDLVQHLRAHAPPERRDAMVRDVAVYREIADAFAAAG